MKNKKIIFSLFGFTSILSLISCGTSINSDILNLTHFTNKKFSLFAKSKQFYSPYSVSFSLIDELKITDLFTQNKLTYHEVKLSNENFYMFSFTENNLNYYFELKDINDETYKYNISPNLLFINDASFNNEIEASFPYYLVDKYYKDVDSENNLLFETSNTYSEFKEFYESCAEKEYTFDDTKNEITISNMYKIIVENGKGYLEKI